MGHTLATLTPLVRSGPRVSSSTRHVCILLTWLLLGGAAVRARQSAQGNQSAVSPAQPEVIWVDAGPLPTSLKQLWTKTAVVVRGEVTSVSEPRRHPTDRAPLAIRFYTIRVIEIAKTAKDLEIEPGRIVRVMQFGGTIVDQGHEIRTISSATVLSAGLEAYFFLNKLENPDAYTIVHDDAGVFRIVSGDLVQVPQLLKHVPELQDRETVPSAELKKILRHLD